RQVGATTWTQKPCPHPRLPREACDLGLSGRESFLCDLLDLSQGLLTKVGEVPLPENAGGGPIPAIDRRFHINNERELTRCGRGDQDMATGLGNFLVPPEQLGFTL